MLHAHTHTKPQAFLILYLTYFLPVSPPPYFFAERVPLSEEMALAFMMGTHRRLGSMSPALFHFYAHLQTQLTSPTPVPAKPKASAAGLCVWCVCGWKDVCVCAERGSERWMFSNFMYVCVCVCVCVSYM